jgi:hypothetical protein
MKPFFDVIKVLFLINGVIVVPSFFLVMEMYKQQSKTMAKVSEINDLSSKFHRNIQDDTPNYHQQIEANRQQLEKRIEKLEVEQEQEIQALKAELIASQLANAVTEVVDESLLPKTATAQVTIASQPIKQTRTSKPSVERPVLAKKTIASQPTAQTQLPQTSRVNTIAPTTRNTDIAFSVTKTNPNKPQLSKGQIAGKPPETSEISSVPQSSQEETISAFAEQFISAANLPKVNQKQAKNSSQQIVTPQATTPIKESITLANDLSMGLIVADRKNQLNYGTKKYRQVQTAISSLRKGSSNNLEEAAKVAGIEPSVLTQLFKWGQNRPGSFERNYITKGSY